MIEAGPDGTLLVGTERAGRFDDPEARAELLRSQDAGETWDVVERLDVSEVTAIAFGPGGAAYAGTGFAAPVAYRSLDGGATWTELGPVATGDDSYQQIMSLAVSADGSVVAGLNSGGLFRSTDRAQTWSPVLRRGFVPELATVGPAQLFAAGGGDVYQSLDSGASWTPTGLDLPYLRDVALGLDGRAHAVARGGLYRSKGAIVTSEPEPDRSGMRLSASPNPSGGDVAVSLETPSPGPVSVALYDALGREVLRLHDGMLGAGKHVFSIDGSAPAPGVYLLRAHGGFQESDAATIRISLVR